MVFLIADDSDALRKMVKWFMESPDRSFIESADGQAAINDYAHYQPDWVIMDIEMQKTNGIAATRKIIKKFPDANIILLTQYDDPHLEKAALEAGAKACLLKEDMAGLTEFFENKLKTQT
jgi:DNA-binding NarL/FixJ family response regulator